MAGSADQTQCPRCATVVSGGASHCPHCGARLKRISIWEDLGRALLVAFLSLVALLFGAAGACFLLLSGMGGVWALLIGAALLLIAWAALKGAIASSSPSSRP